jgi:hypothetical protein
MTLTLEQFQKDAAPWLAKLKETGEPLVLLAGKDAFEVRPAGALSPEEALAELQKLLPKRTSSIITGDPEDIVHMDWSSEWRP